MGCGGVGMEKGLDWNCAGETNAGQETKIPRSPATPSIPSQHPAGQSSRGTTLPREFHPPILGGLVDSIRLASRMHKSSKSWTTKKHISWQAWTSALRLPYQIVEWYAQFQQRGPHAALRVPCGCTH